jgi:hypothetical protein
MAFSFPFDFVLGLYSVYASVSCGLFFYAMLFYVLHPVANHLKEKDEVREDVELESQKPATEDECLKTSCDASNAAGQQKAALDSKLQEPNEVSSLTWCFDFHLISY